MHHRPHVAEEQKSKVKPKATKQPKPERQPKLKRIPKARTPKTAAEVAAQQERRREYDRQRNQTPERQEYQRLQAQEHRRNAREAGRCRGCPDPAIPNQTRCEVCAEKHRASRRKSRARRNEEPESTVTTVALPLDASLLEGPTEHHRMF